MADNGQEIWQHFEAEEYSQKLLALGQRLESLWQAKGFQEPEIRLRLLIEEAINNAWEHGNKYDTSKKIILSWSLNERFYFTVEDEGEGFNPAAIPDPRTGEHLSQSRGRGIFLIRHYANSVKWENGGRRMTMCFESAPKN